MSKAFVKESDDDDEELEVPQIAGVRNYITPDGYGRLKQELVQLLMHMMAGTSGNGQATAAQ